VKTIEAKKEKAGATYKGSLPDTHPIYKGGWNFLLGKDLNPALPANESLEQKEKPPEQ
jgi:hypothetical protein